MSASLALRPCFQVSCALSHIYIVHIPLQLQTFCFQEFTSLFFFKKIKNSFNNRRPDLFLATGRLNEGGRDHLKVSLCWKHQVMTFITNDLGPPAMNLDNTD